MGCTGNALATCIDAPPKPKVSLIRIRSQLSAEVLGAANRPYMSVELCNLAGKGGGVKEFVRNLAGTGFPQ